MKKYEVLLIDLDDTLIDYSKSVKYAFKQILAFVNQEYSDEKFRQWCHFDQEYWYDYHSKGIDIPIEYRTSKELLTDYIRSVRYQLFFENTITIEEAFKINNIFLDSLLEIAIPMDGVYSILEYLSGKYKLYIATNGAIYGVKAKLEKINSLQFFSGMFSADMTKSIWGKPNIDYFEELMEYINYSDKEKILMIGNSLNEDIKGAMNMGIDSCWFNPNKIGLDDNYKPTYIIGNLMDLKKIL